MDEWVTTKLSELIDVKHGYAFKGEYFYDDPPGDLLLTPGNFAIGGGFQWGKKKFYRGPVLDEFILSPGDLLVTMTDLSKEADTLGYSAVVPSSQYRMLHNQRLGKVIVKSPQVSKAFVHWLMRSKDYRNEILANFTGSTVKHTSPTKITAYQFNFPPLQEQFAIAGLLDALEDKINLNQRMNETLEAMAGAIFKDWFVDFGPTRAKAEGRPPYLASDLWSLFPATLDDEDKPTDWGVRSVFEIASFINGAAYKNMHFSPEGNGFPVIKIAELKSGVTLQTKFTKTDLGERYKIETGEVLFAWSGNPDTSIDLFIWVDGPAWLNQHIFRVRENGSADKTFIYFQLKELKPTFAEIARNKQTTGLGHVTAQDMKELMVCDPSTNVATAYNEVCGPIFSQITANLLETRSLTQLRDLLLPKLMSGEVCLREAEKLVGEGV